MKIFLWALFSFVAVALQLTIAPRLAIFSVVPNFLLAGILAAAIGQHRDRSDWLILIPILLFDLIAGRSFGILSLISCLTFFFIDRLGLLLLKKEDWFAILSLIVIGILFFEATSFLSKIFLSGWQIVELARPTFSYFYAILPLSILYNGILAIFFGWCANKMHLFNYDRQIAKF